MSGSRERRGLVAALLCAGAGAALFQFLGNATRGYIATDSLFYWWGFQWVNPDSETEHAWLVLALSLFLLVRNLRGSAAGEREPEPRAAAALLGALLLHALGFIAQQPRVSILALLLYAWGCLALAGGRRWASASAFPVAFMVFAIPVNALDSIGFWLRMGVVRVGAQVAHLAGIAVIRNGTQLISRDGRYQYDVVAACSGIRSLVALAALSLFLGYLWFKPAWLRGAFFLLSFPLVFLGNVLRISAIIIAAAWGGQAWGDRIHGVMGAAVFAVVLGGVIGAAEWVSRRFPAWTADRPAPGAPAPRRARGDAPMAVAAAVLLAVCLDGAYLSHRARVPPPEKAGVTLAEGGANPVELPTFLDSGWMGSRIEPTAVERTILPPDTGYSRKLYLNQEGRSRQVLLSIVLSGRDRTSIHRPELCLAGQGWTVDESTVHRFSYPGRADAGFQATILKVRRENHGANGDTLEPDLVAYWFVGGDRIVPSMGERMMYDAWNRVVHGRADRWAYVLLQTRADDGEAAALSRMQSVLLSALPAFQPALAPR